MSADWINLVAAWVECNLVECNLGKRDKPLTERQVDGE